MFTIARPIEGITLNGLEFLMDDETGKPRTFATEDLAVLYLQATDFGHMTAETIKDVFVIQQVPDDNLTDQVH